MGAIEFTDNYQDLSTDKGFQFKFCCEKCGNGYLSSYKMNTLGVAEGLLGAASSIFGGMFGGAQRGAYEIQRAVGGKAHDSALQEATTEIRPKFTQCRRCGQWVCREICFNAAANQCKYCAPIAEQEETALRAEHVRAEIGGDLQLEEVERLKLKEAAVQAKCSDCGEPTLGKKFCPSCGKPTAAVIANCPKCGSKLNAGVKFCGDCGNPVK